MRAILFSQMEPPAASDEDFNDWYNTEHIPIRLALRGMNLARRFTALAGTPKYLAVYEAGVLDNPAVPRSMQPLVIMEELLAHLGETTGSFKRLLQEFVGLVRAFLRKHGFLDVATLKVSDLAVVLRAARKAAQAADRGSRPRRTRR